MATIAEILDIFVQTHLFRIIGLKIHLLFLDSERDLKGSKQKTGS